MLARWPGLFIQPRQAAPVGVEAGRDVLADDHVAALGKALDTVRRAVARGVLVVEEALREHPAGVKAGGRGRAPVVLEVPQPAFAALACSRSRGSTPRRRTTFVTSERAAAGPRRQQPKHRRPAATAIAPARRPRDPMRATDRRRAGHGHSSGTPCRTIVGRSSAIRTCDFAEETPAPAQISLLCAGFQLVQAESQVPAGVPLEVVDQRPVVIAAHVEAPLDQGVHAAHRLDDHRGPHAVERVRVAVLGDHERLAEPRQPLVEGADALRVGLAELLLGAGIAARRVRRRRREAVEGGAPVARREAHAPAPVQVDRRGSRRSPSPRARRCAARAGPRCARPRPPRGTGRLNMRSLSRAAHRSPRWPGRSGTNAHQVMRPRHERARDRLVDQRVGTRVRARHVALHPQRGERVARRARAGSRRSRSRRVE